MALSLVFHLMIKCIQILTSNCESRFIADSKLTGLRVQSDSLNLLFKRITLDSELGGMAVGIKPAIQ